MFRSLGLGLLVFVSVFAFSAGSASAALTLSALAVSSDGAIAVSSDTTSAATFDSGSTGAVNVGTGVAAKAVTIGSITTTAATTIQSGTGDVTVTSTDDIVITATDDFTLNGGSAGSIINLGTNTHGNVINIGTDNTAADTINIGSALDTTTVAGTIKLSAAGVQITNDGDGAITLLGLGDGSDEDLTINLDDTADTAVLSSSTGVATLSLSGIALSTTTSVTAATFMSAGSYRVTNNAVLTKADVNLSKAEIQGASFFPVDTTANAVDVDFGDDAALDAADILFAYYSSGADLPLF